MSMAFFLLFFLLFFLGMFLLFSFSLKRQEKNQEELLREQKAMRHAMERLARLVEKSFEELPVQGVAQAYSGKGETPVKAPAAPGLSMEVENKPLTQAPHISTTPDHLELVAENTNQAHKNMAGKSAQNNAAGLPELKL